MDPGRTHIPYPYTSIPEPWPHPWMAIDLNCVSWFVDKTRLSLTDEALVPQYAAALPASPRVHVAGLWDESVGAG